MSDFPIPVELRQRLDLILEACPGPPEGWPQAYAGTLAYTRPGGWAFSFGFPLRSVPPAIEHDSADASWADAYQTPLIGDLYGPHEWGYRDPVEGGFIGSIAPFKAAEVLALMQAALEAAGEALEPYEDADHNGAAFVPNAAMCARLGIRTALDKALGQ